MNQPLSQTPSRNKCAVSCPPPPVPPPSLDEKLAAAQEMLATLRAVMAAREREAEARRIEEVERLRARHAAVEDRLRTRLAAVEREAAALRAVGGDDGQCARSRPYYWQR